MKPKLITIWLFNLTDIIATLYFTSNGMMVEANPIMAVLLHYPPLFVAVKLIAMTLLCVYLYARNSHKLARTGTNIGVVMYGLLTVWYIVNFIIL